MSDALIEIAGLRKSYQALRPLRIRDLVVHRGECVALSGLDAGAAEMLVHLITGASVPDEGAVHVFGRRTTDIATDREWLASLEGFGIVTERAVLLESLTVAQNLALPITLAIDPIAADVLARVEALAADAGFEAQRLAVAVSQLSPEERVRLHIARALATDPVVVLLEHPTARMDPARSAAVGETLARAAASRGAAVVAVTEDEAFANAACAIRLRLEPATGELKSASGFLRRLLMRS